MKFLNSNICPFVIIFTKSDKLKLDKIEIQIENLKKQLSHIWHKFPELYVTSSKDKSGINKIFNFIEDTLIKYEN